MKNPGLIIEPDQLEALLDDDSILDSLLIVDLCQQQTYDTLHIPGAVHINPAQLVCGIPPATGKLPALEQLNSLFSSIGYAPHKHIVVYDDEGGGWAGRFIWTLDIIGHQSCSYLNGGLHAWYKEGHAVSNEAAAVDPAPVSLQIDRSYIADLEEIKDSLQDPQVKIWDARSAEEFDGSKISAQRGGHIPGAVNLDWLNTMDQEHNLRLLPLDKLQGMLQNLAIDKQHSIITHCQTHHRSGLTYLICKALGIPCKAYDGSWAEWGNRPDTPIET